MFEQLGLIGCGLMGGSFALALKRAGLVRRVVGYSKSPSTTERARKMGVIDVEAPSALLAVAGADIVLLAVPVAATERTLKSIKHLITPQMLVMDVGSTKADVVSAARSALSSALIGPFPSAAMSWSLSPTRIFTVAVALKRTARRRIGLGKSAATALRWVARRCAIALLCISRACCEKNCHMYLFQSLKETLIYSSCKRDSKNRHCHSGMASNSVFARSCNPSAFS